MGYQRGVRQKHIGNLDILFDKAVLGQERVATSQECSARIVASYVPRSFEEYRFSPKTLDSEVFSSEVTNIPQIDLQFTFWFSKKYESKNFGTQPNSWSSYYKTLASSFQ